MKRLIKFQMIVFLFFFVSPEISTAQESDYTILSQTVGSSKIVITVDKIIVKNSSILTQDHIEIINNRWQGEYQLDELNEIKELGLQISDFITRIYHSEGFTTSRAIFPVQDQLTDGIFIIEVIEGYMEKISLTGLNKLNQDYILSRIPSAYKKPLNTLDLEADLKKLRQDYLIKNLTALLELGTQSKHSRLSLKIEENKTQTLSFQGNNTAPASTGSEEGFFTYKDDNLLGGGQQLLLQINASEGKELGYASFNFPLTSENLRLQFRGKIESNEIIVAPLQQFDFENDVFTYGIDFIYPFFENAQSSFSLKVSYDNHESQTFILGERFEFDERFPNGIAQYETIRLSSQWVYRTKTNALSFRPQLNFGLNRSFFYGQLFLDFVQPVSEDISFLFHLKGQVADGILFPQEQCKIGGDGIFDGAIRGYTRQAFRNDNCLAATLQGSWSFFNNDNLRLEITPFIQAASVFKAEDSLIPDETLATIGIELGVYLENFFIKGFSSLPLVDVDEDFKQPFGVSGGIKLSF
ncbi:ShlB/FhaC/HecB family hemolysin secretion/activation protein [Crocosphaera sp. Alani8]|uniref:ShlB/FhaC/HecB family hemolysin secretion/activation protein n=1 Tax=Crocosphaera sp. Alani8 TaxID=3038952 RepID=UPI00313A9424